MDIYTVLIYDCCKGNTTLIDAIPIKANTRNEAWGYACELIDKSLFDEQNTNKMIFLYYDEEENIF